MKTFYSVGTLTLLPHAFQVYQFWPDLTVDLFLLYLYSKTLKILTSLKTLVISEVRPIQYNAFISKATDHQITR